jgi:hypothetical protein
VLEEGDELAIARNRRNAWSIAIVLLAVALMLDSKLSPFRLFSQSRAYAPVVAKQANRSVTSPSIVSEQSVASIAPASASTNVVENSRAVDESGDTSVDNAAQIISQNPSTGITAAADVAVHESAETRSRNNVPQVVSTPAKQQYVPPSTIDERGVRTYTQYSLPQPHREAEPPPVPASGDKGIEQLLSEGRIRKATPSDMERWLAASNIDRNNSPSMTIDYKSGNQYLFRTYVVTREMTFPEGLYGAHSATFIVPREVPRPSGNAGHSRILEMP